MNWPTVTLRELTEPVAKWNPRQETPSVFTYIDLGAVDNTLKKVTAASSISTTDAPSRARQIVRAGDILVSTVRPNLNAVAMVPPELDGATSSTGFSVLRPNTRIDRGYLSHWVQTDQFISDLVRKATGASYPAVSDRIIKDCSIPLAPLDEQRRIAAILDQAGSIRSRQTRSQHLLGSVAQAMFVKSFGDVSSSSKNAVPLRDVISRISSGTSLKCEPRSRDSATNEPGILKLSSITQGIFNPQENKAFPAGGLAADDLVRSGDLLMCRKNTKELVGAAALVDRSPSNLYLPDLIYRIEYDTSQVIGEYLLGAFRTKEVRHDLETAASGSSASMANISRARLLNIRVHIPPMEDQVAYATKLRGISAQERRTAKRKELTDVLVNALRSRAFRGEL